MTSATANVPEIAETLKEIATIANAETGIAATRAELLKRRALAETIAGDTASVVQSFANAAASLGDASLVRIAGYADALQRQAGSANQTMQLIAIACIFIMAITAAFAYLTIARPIKTLTAATQRLAKGDAGLIAVSFKSGGEIGAMARALGVFRDTLLEKKRLEEEEKEAQRRAEERDAREEAAERQRQEKEAARLQAEDERERAEEERRRTEREAREAREREILEEQRLHKEREEAERARIEQAAEAERARQAAEQASVVDALAEGLRQLSRGNLDARIEQEFAAGYERLRLDFNATLDSLAVTVESIIESSRPGSAPACQRSIRPRAASPAAPNRRLQRCSSPPQLCDR